MNQHLVDDFTPEFDPFTVDPQKVLEWREAHRCPECRRVTDSKTRKGNEHWPYCSKATIEQKSAWARRAELRSLRTIGRIDA